MSAVFNNIQHGEYYGEEVLLALFDVQSAYWCFHNFRTTF